MDYALPNIPNHLARPRDPLPNLRGEDESELSYLQNLIESLSWILIPSKHASCILGRHPPPKHASTSTPASPTDLFCASLYSMGKGMTRELVYGPETGKSRKEVLGKLLEVVEMEIGRLMLNDRYHLVKAGGKEGGGKAEK